MTECNCGGDAAKSADEEIVETEEVELAAGLDEPVEVGKEEALMKDMEATLAKLKEVLAYLEDMGEEKAEEEEEEEEEEKMMEEEEKADTIDDLHKAVTTLKKHGISVYTGRKATPAPAANDSPKVENIDFNNVEKSFEEIEALYDGGM